MKLFYVGAGPSPRLLVRSGDRPDHLAATAVGCRYEINWHTSSKGMPRHAHGRWALMLVCGRQLECCEMSVMCKFHKKTYHTSNSQNRLSLFLNFSNFYRVCVLTCNQRYASTYLRNGGRLNVCGVDDNVVNLCKVMTRSL